MKLTLIFLTVAFVHVYAYSGAQNVSLHAKNVPLKKVFTIVEKQTGYELFTTKDVLSKTHSVTVNVQDMPLTNFLADVLKDQPVNFKIEGKTIILTKKAPAEVRVTAINPLKITAVSVSLPPLPPPPVPIKGRVTDENGKPLAKASVLIKGTKFGTTTDENGEFNIEVNSKAIALVVSYVGYESVEVNIKGKTQINVALKAIVEQTQEVVVTSMGITKQAKELGYATTTIKSDELVATAPTNFATALYGKAPGVRIAAAPGGSTSGVVLQIRGLSSITGRTQPLIVMDGVPIHDIATDYNSSTSFVSSSRIQSNGLTDLNPEDIESITVLKGASAAALYGSEATNGVLLITTKKGRQKKGFSVDANVSYFQDRIAFYPHYQMERGSGVPVQCAKYYGLSEDANGFNATTYTIDGVAYRAMNSTSVNFGPVYDGKPFACWDNVVRPYVAHKNGYKHIYQNANNVIENVSFSNMSDNSNTRFSVSKQHYEGVSRNSSNDKYVFNLNTTYNFGKKFKLNLIADDIYSIVNNRPYSSFPGTSSYDDGNWYETKYQTSLGYKYVTGTTQSLTPDENIKIPYQTLLSYFWTLYKNLTKEKQNRLIASATAYWDILPNLQFRGRIATDWTSMREEEKDYSTVPIIYGYSGAYAITTKDYSILYGDALLSYSKKINKDLELKAMGGYTADNEASYQTYLSTNGGLIIENRFDLSSSYSSTLSTSSSYPRTYLTKDAFIGTVNANYKGYLFVEGTIRRDKTSTMNPNKNAFTYPSVNASLILSDVFKLPEVINYAKLRGSWGIVGNYPEAYQANVAYTLSSLGNQGNGSILATNVSTGSYGNDAIRPEKKHELEIGLEAKFLHNKIGLDVAYYANKVKDMILPLEIPMSSGSSSILTNVGNLKNAGLEIALNATAVQTKNFSWEPNVNFSFNKNKITKLYTGSNSLITLDQDGEAAEVINYVGQPIGDIYAHPVETDVSGNPVVVDNGSGDVIYQISSSWKKYGNTQPKVIGGFGNTFKYKNFSLELYTDFRIGGSVLPVQYNYQTSRGLTKESLNHMDAAHGGVSYYLDANNHGIETTGSTGPNGETVYHDGMKLGGVFADGTKNSYVTPQFFYYWETYNWGGPQYSNSQYFKYVEKNSYWKMREITLSYVLPNKFSKKINLSKLQVSVFGRNLFYFYKTLKDMDAEQLTGGTNWKDNLTAATQPSTRTFGVSLRATF